MSWLSSWLKKTKVSAGEPTCFLPTPHKNAPLLNLKEDQFICPSMLDYIAEVKLDCNIIQYCKKLPTSYEPQRLFFNKIENFYPTLPLLYVTCIMNCVHQPWFCNKNREEQRMLYIFKGEIWGISGLW